MAALAVFSAAETMHAQCAPIVRFVSQPAIFPNLIAGPVATDGRQVLVAKRDGTTTSPAIYLQTFDANLNSTSADRLIATSSANGAVALFYADTANEFGLFYQRPDTTLVLQRIDLSGNPIGGPIIMPHSWSSNDEFDIAWDHAAGAYAIAHVVTGARDLGLWLTMVSPAGSTISDTNVSVFVATPANPRVATLTDGSAAVMWTSNLHSTFVAIVKGSAIANTTLISNQPTISAKIAASNSSILTVYSIATTAGGTQLRYVLLNTSGAIITPDTLLLNGRGVDVAPLSLQWNSALSEWALVYADSPAGFNLFPGDVRLRRFQSVSGPVSDTLLSPNSGLSLLNAPYPLVFLNGGYVGSIARFVSTAQGGESYLIRFCPLIGTFTIDTSVAHTFSPITFRASASGGMPGYSYSWAFGDNDSATGSVVQHRYSANGTYTVTLTATDAAGATSVSKMTVLITDQLRGRAARH